MKIIDISNSELFENLLEVNNKDLYIDIHNDFDLKSISYLLETNTLELTLLHTDVSNELYICFENVKFIELDITQNIDLTLDNFHRGKFELDGKLYDDYLGKKCFYLEFYDDGKLSLLAEKIYIKFHP